MKDINSFSLVRTLKTLMCSRLLTCDSNKLSFTFYAVNYVTETCIEFLCDYTGSIAGVTTTQYVTFLCYLKVRFFSWKVVMFSSIGKVYLMYMVSIVLHKCNCLLEKEEGSSSTVLQIDIQRLPKPTLRLTYKDRQRPL